MQISWLEKNDKITEYIERIPFNEILSFYSKILTPLVVEC